MSGAAVLPSMVRSALRPLACAMVAFTVLPAQADLVTLTGPRFDILYDNSSFLYETGLGIEQLGGLSIVGPNTVRYTMRPVRVVPSDLPGFPPEIEYKNFIQVGGIIPFDLLADGDFFGVRPKDGNGVLSVRMLTAGRFSNPNGEGLDLVYSEQLAAGGVEGQQFEFLGGAAVPSGPLPSGLQVDFAAPLVSPFGVKFDYSLRGEVTRTVGSTFDANADIRYVDIEIATVSAPIPEPGTWVLMLAGLAGIGALAQRRRA